MKVTTISLLAGSVLTLGMTAASANDVYCSDYGGLINEHVNDKVIADVDCTIGMDGYVDNDIEADGKSVTVFGTVNGNIKQWGRKGVAVDGGSVDGNIEEKDAGGVSIALAEDDSINGDVKEEGPGNVIAVIDGLFNGNISEKGRGDLKTSGDGMFNGNTKEENRGKCSNTIEYFDGNACE